MLEANRVKLDCAFLDLNVLRLRFVFDGIFRVENLRHVVCVTKDTVHRLQDIVYIPKVAKNHGCILCDQYQGRNIHTKLRTKGLKHRRSHDTGNQD